MFLETPRLIIRKFEDEDFNDFWAYANDLEMCRMLRGSKLLPEKDIAKRERMCNYLKASGYRNLGSFGAMLRYPDVVLAKLFAYYI